LSTYLVARAHGLNTRLLPPNFFEALASVKKIREIINLLSPTEYSKYIEKGEEIDIESLYKVFAQVFSDRLRLISIIPLSRDLAEFRDNIIMKYEIENVIKILLGLKAKKDFNEIEKYLIPGLKSKINYNELYQERTVERAIQYLKTKGFRIGEKALELYTKYDTILPIEKELLRNNYKKLIEKASKLGRETKMLVKKLVGIESDIENIFTSTASLLYGYSTELIENLILPFPGKVDTKTFLAIVNSRNPREALEKLSMYNEITVPLLNKDEFKAKIASLKYLSSFLNSYKISSSMTPPYLLYLIRKMEYEYKYLIYISYSIYYGSKPEISSEMLIK